MPRIFSSRAPRIRTRLEAAPFASALLLSLAFAPVGPRAVAAQDAEPAPPTDRPARIGVPVADSLPADGVHAFTLEVTEDRFVRGAVDQITLDVVVTVTGPDGARVARFDGPASGEEYFAFDADEPGTYRIEVTPFEDATGRYAFELAVVEPIAEAPEERVDQLLARFDRPDVPGGVIGVVRDGRLVFAKGYGEANLAHGIPFTTDTRTNIGSTSKQFTAFAIQLLADRGELSLDDDVRDHLPELKDFGQTVTLRHLLTHTSGYREFLNLLAMGGRRLDYDYVDRAELIQIVGRQPELQNAPGAEWNYNNTGYGLLAQVVEKVGGKPFAEWMRENVFLPLGMEHTMVRTDPRTIVPDGAMGYALDEGDFEEASDLGGAMGAGGIYTTVGDLAAWMGNYFDPTLGDARIADEMMSRYVLSDGDTTGYGLGLFVDEYHGLRRVHHGGADIAHRSTFMMFPELDGGVIILSNLASFPGGIAAEVSEAFFGDRYVGDGAGTTAVADAGYDPADFDSETFDDYAGKYSLDEMPNFVLTFRRDGDKYYTQATGQPEVEIAPTSDSTFRILVVDASITFHRDDDGTVGTMTLHQNGDHPGTRVAGEPLTEEQLAAYAGRYYSAELEAYWEVITREGELVATHRRLDDVTLTPSPSGEDAFGGSFPFATVDFERGEDGAVTGFRAANARTRGVLFEKVR